MKTLRILSLLLVAVLIICCKKKTEDENAYEFVKPYCAKITVGGFVGISEKCFAIGDRVQGKNVKEGVIAVRVAQQTAENDKPANPNSYQEFVDVPSEYLKLTAL